MKTNVQVSDTAAMEIKRHGDGVSFTILSVNDGEIGDAIAHVVVTDTRAIEIANEINQIVARKAK